LFKNYEARKSTYDQNCKKMTNLSRQMRFQFLERSIHGIDFPCFSFALNSYSRKLLWASERWFTDIFILHTG